MTEIKIVKLPTSWAHLNPMKTGFITVLALFCLQQLVLEFYRPYAVNLFQSLGEVPLVFKMLAYLLYTLLVVMALLPNTLTLYFYRTSNELASYKTLFKKAFTVGIVANSLSILTIASLNKALDPSDEHSIRADWVMIFLFSLVISLPINALISFPFVKNATTSTRY